jgi:predicted nucleotide-binding protein (sugar kinase/HSP70/actin superfamily)
LSDGFQQIPFGFAQLIELNIEPNKLFPNFQIKFRQSVILRQNLRDVLKSARQAEQNPDIYRLKNLREEFTDFLDATLHFLFYKQRETVERFIEEVLVTTDKKDRVPIPRRFGANVETLFAQVNMRTALVKYPFELKDIRIKQSNTHFLSFTSYPFVFTQ